MLAAQYGDVLKIKELIAEGVDINYYSNEYKVLGVIALMIAILALQPQAVTVLMQAGANPDY